MFRQELPLVALPEQEKLKQLGKKLSIAVGAMKENV